MYPTFRTHIDAQDYENAIKTLAAYALQNAVEFRYDMKVKEMTPGTQEYIDFGPIRDHACAVQMATDTINETYLEDLQEWVQQIAADMLKVGELE